MLSDAPFTSPWSPEVLIRGDYTLSVVSDTDEDDELDLYNFSKKLSEELDDGGGVGSMSGVGTSSECSSEDLYWAASDAGFMHDAHIADNMEAMQDNLNHLIDSAVIDNIERLDSNVSNSSSVSNSGGSKSSSNSTVDWSPGYRTIPEGSQAFTCTTLNQSANFQASRGHKGSRRKWSSMSKSEKLKLLDELSLTIGQELGLREKMDIIKIINPNANWSKQQTEFIIDLKALDDSKLEKIENVVNFHCVQAHDHLDNDLCSPPHRKFSKRSKSRDRRPKLERQRVQKESRQKLKERRSGLFIQEEILAVSSSSIEEEIDVMA